MLGTAVLSPDPALYSLEGRVRSHSSLGVVKTPWRVCHVQGPDHLSGGRKQTLGPPSWRVPGLGTCKCRPGWTASRCPHTDPVGSLTSSQPARPLWAPVPDPFLGRALSHSAAPPVQAPCSAAGEGHTDVGVWHVQLWSPLKTGGVGRPIAAWATDRWSGLWEMHRLTSISVTLSARRGRNGTQTPGTRRIPPSWLVTDVRSEWMSGVWRGGIERSLSPVVG